MARDAGDAALARYLQREVTAFSAYHRARVHAALEGAPLRTRADLGRLPLSTLAGVADPGALVLRPDWSTLDRSAEPGLQARATLSRRAARSAVEHRYKPIHWHLDAGVPVGWSAADLERLGALGAAWLARAGVGPADVLVGVVAPGPHVAYWELVLGARQASVPAVHFPPVPAGADVARLEPTVVAGRPFDLARLLDAGHAARRPLTSLRTLLCVGEPLEEPLRAKLAALAGGDVVVAAAWAPPGVRALWSECRGGAATVNGPRPGLHTSPEAEVVEVVDPLSGNPAPPGADGEVVWTALGWRGTVFVRLRTGTFAAVAGGACPACGAPGERLSVVSDTPAFLSVLDRHPEVTGWQAELRTVEGDEELVVFLAPAPAASVPRLLASLDAELSATQYVVLDAAGLDARLSASDDRRVLDLRA